MHEQRFAALVRAMTPPRSRRAFLITLALLGLTGGETVAKKHKKKHKKKHQTVDKGTERVNYCRAVTVPAACNFSDPNLQTQCVSDLTACCEQAQVSWEPFCACAATHPWGTCFF